MPTVFDQLFITKCILKISASQFDAFLRPQDAQYEKRKAKQGFRFPFSLPLFICPIFLPSGKLLFSPDNILWIIGIQRIPNRSFRLLRHHSEGRSAWPYRIPNQIGRAFHYGIWIAIFEAIPDWSNG